jgi:hypothetical protein
MSSSGKSLSIICSALKWLKDQQKQQEKELEKEIETKKDDNEPDWVNEQYQQQKVHYNLNIVI